MDICIICDEEIELEDDWGYIGNDARKCHYSCIVEDDNITVENTETE